MREPAPPPANAGAAASCGRQQPRAGRTDPIARALISQNTTIEPEHAPPDRAHRYRSPVAIDDLVAMGRSTIVQPDPRPTVPGPGWPGRRLYSSVGGSSSTLTSLNVSTRTFGTNRVLRYMSHTHASAQLHFDHRASGVTADGELDVVGQVEPALGLHGVAEHGRDVLVLLSELELALGLEVLEIVGAQSGCSLTPMRQRNAIRRRAFP